MEEDCVLFCPFAVALPCAAVQKGHLRDCLGASLGPFCFLLTASWGPLRPSWGFLGPSGGAPGPPGSLGDRLGHLSGLSRGFHGPLEGPRTHWYRGKR